MLFKKYEDAERDSYLANQRAMAVAHARTQNQEDQERRDLEAARRQQENKRDQDDLAYVNSSHMHATQNLAGGLTQKSFA